MQELTAEQQETIHELQAELAALDIKADIEWAKYIHTKDVDCWNEVVALESQREMLGLIAYIPKAGEKKVSKVRELIAKVQGKPEPHLDRWEARLRSLEAVNEWRAEYELPALDRLPQGIPGNAEECTLAMAFHKSLQEMGAEEINVQVQDGFSISLNWMGQDGGWNEASPTLGEAASTLIGGFDENAWLDLLTDGTLRAYAEDVVGEGGLSRLQEVSDELARRGMTQTAGGFELGKDAPEVNAQENAIENMRSYD